MTKFLSDKFKVLSFISIILVLYIHSGFHDYPNEIQGMVFNTNLQNFISGMIGRCAVPLFYAISGYLFFTGLYDGGNANYPKLWFKIKKRGKTLLVPYIIACLFPVVFNLVLEFIPGIEQFVNNKGISKNFHQPIDKILNFIYFDSGNGSPYAFHLWFLRDLIFIVVLYITLCERKNQQICSLWNTIRSELFRNTISAFIRYVLVYVWILLFR